VNDPVNRIDSVGLDDKAIAELQDTLAARDRVVQDLAKNPDVKTTFQSTSPRTPVGVPLYVWKTGKFLNACNKAVDERERLEKDAKAKREHEEKVKKLKKVLWDNLQN
jgi:hypothetical protein